MKKTLIALLAASLSVASWAIPARPGVRFVTDSKGDTLEVWAHGDEHFHWYTDKAGQWWEPNAEGLYHRVEALSEEAIAERRQARMAVAEKASVRRAMRKTPIHLNIAPRGLVILVSYSDKEFATSYTEMQAMVNSDHYTRDYSYTYRSYEYHVHSEGSARQYFIDQSMGQYTPQFDVVGPYTLPRTLAYYGQDSYYGHDQNAHQMIIDACKAADPDVDFSKYDCDGDGEIDFVYVIYAGFGQADGGPANTIWPHTFFVKDGAGQTVRLDGKLLNTYACGNELEYISKQHMGIGVFCHEFSHVLGLPDLYATSDATHRTMCDWDIMDSGSYNNSSNTPPAYSSYERFFLGWLTPTILNQPATLSLSEIQSSNKAYIITETGESNLVGNDPYPGTFFLIENRQQTGWDKHLPGHGMLLTKVRYTYSAWTQNAVNNTARSMGVDIIEADGKTSSNYGKPKDLFPAGATEYTPFEQYPITHIKEMDGRIVLDFMGGEDWIASLAKETASSEDPKGREYTVVEGVYDISGRLIQTGSTLTDLAPGMYIIKMGDGGTGKDHHSRGAKIYIR